MMKKDTGPKKSLLLGLLLMAACTFFSAAGQLLFRLGAMEHAFTISLLLTNPFIIAGYLAFGLGGILFLLALRQGELSVIYPFVSMTFIWVAFFSVAILKEKILPLQIVGLGIIITGVWILVRGGRDG